MPGRLHLPETTKYLKLLKVLHDLPAQFLPRQAVERPIRSSAA
jgi:hypothetical protein